MQILTNGKVNKGDLVVKYITEDCSTDSITLRPNFDCVRDEIVDRRGMSPMFMNYLIKADDYVSGAAAAGMLFRSYNRLGENIIIESSLADELGPITAKYSGEWDPEKLGRIAARADSMEIPMLIKGSTNIDLDDYLQCGFAAVIERTPDKEDPQGVDAYLNSEAEYNNYTVLDVRRPTGTSVYLESVRCIHDCFPGLEDDECRKLAESFKTTVCDSELFMSGGYRNMRDVGKKVAELIDKAISESDLRSEDVFEQLLRNSKKYMEEGDSKNDEDYYEDEEEYYKDDYEDEDLIDEEELCGDAPDDIIPLPVGAFDRPPFGLPGMPMFPGLPGMTMQPPEPPPTLDFTTLDEMRGQKNVKDKLNSIITSRKFEKRIADTIGKANTSEGCNILFLGNPGTAKTTSARAFAKELEKAGIVPPNSFVELRKSDFVGQYVGMTEEKIDRIFASHADGAVLLWDEIYSVAGENRTSYDEQAVTSIIQGIENYRGRIINIFAGYKKESMRFLDTNPGLLSRITDIVCFDDLDNETLIGIFCSFVEKKGIKLEQGLNDVLDKFFTDLKALKGPKFGNGRDARNLFTAAVRKLAERAGKLPEEDGIPDMTREDILAAIDDVLKEAHSVSEGDDNTGRRPIGFCAT